MLMAAELLLTFSLGGGMPPPASEMLRIHRDGTADAIVGNAWPTVPFDEAGFFRTRLEPGALRELEHLLASPALARGDAEHGPFAADSGFAVLQLYRGGRESEIRWGAFARIPSALADLRERLRKILDEVRRHPEQTVRVEWTVPAEVAAGQPFEVELRLANRGTRALRLAGPRENALPVELRLMAEPAAFGPSAQQPDLFSRAEPAPGLRAVGNGLRDGTLPPAPAGGLALRCTAPLRLEEPGRYHLYGFVRLRLEGTLDGATLPLDTLLLPSPRELIVR